MKKLVKKFIIVFVLIIIVGVLFIKFNTGAAAQFADNVLRPLIGNNTVIYMEQVYFNLSDKITQLTHNDNTLLNPDVNDQSGVLPSGKSDLNLTQIPITHSFKHLKNEGVWLIKKLPQFPDRELMAYTFIRPDQARSFAIVTLLQMDMKAFNLGIVAGIKQPGGPVGKPGPGKIPDEIVNSNKLVAAFDGGFQYRDGQYGMIVGNDTYLPLEKDLGTLIGYKNGELKIVDYIGQDLGKDITFIRQNCPILVDNGQIALQDERNKKLWGRTPTTSIFTWRSGLGLTKEGNLLYAVGNNLTPQSLAQALKDAGAENAIQLDINPFWVRFNFFNPKGNGQYDTTTLTRDLFNGGVKYFSGYDKDFFYLYSK